MNTFGLRAQGTGQSDITVIGGQVGSGIVQTAKTTSNIPRSTGRGKIAGIKGSGGSRGIKGSGK